MWNHEQETEAGSGHLGLRDRLREWWQAATGPVYQPHHASLREAWLGRLSLWAPVLVAVLLCCTGVTLYVLAGWRALDLAGKAVASAEAGQLRLAVVQIESARRLRGSDPRVLLAAAMVSSMAGQPGALAAWGRVPSNLTLSGEEFEMKSRILLQHAPETAVRGFAEELRTNGRPADAEMLLAAKAERAGNLDRAIGHARTAVTENASPGARLELARLLARRHASAGAGSLPSDQVALEEMLRLLDGLRGTALQSEALQLALAVPGVDFASRLARAREVLARLEGDDPALPAAAQVLVDSGERNADEVRGLLEPVMAAAQAEQRLAFAALLNEWGMAEAALELVGEEESRSSTPAFATRADALAATGRWEELLSLATEASDPLRLAARAEAAVRLSRPGLARQAAAEALGSALRTGSWQAISARLDAAGLQAVVDEELLAACGEPVTAAIAFALARDRFSRRGQLASLDRAWESAAAAAPNALTVGDFRRRRALLSGETVDLATTEGAVRAAPSDPDFLATHALALYREGRAAEAWALFGELTVFFRQLTPGQQVIVAVLAVKSGDPETGRRAAASIDRQRLTDDELALLASALPSRRVQR